MPITTTLQIKIDPDDRLLFAKGPAQAISRAVYLPNAIAP
jgi:hypothetical protein